MEGGEKHSAHKAEWRAVRLERNAAVSFNTKINDCETGLSKTNMYKKTADEEVADNNFRSHARRIN